MGVVKKYGNRRLYDTTESRYITLEELAERVRGGDTMTVVDAKSGRDLTQQTLAHIILESRGASKLLPVPLLEQLIRMGDDSLAEFFGMYVSGALEIYVQAKRGAQAMMPYNPFAQALANFGGGAFGGGNPFARMFGGWPMGGPPQAPVEAPRPAAPAGPTADDVAALRRELDALREAIKPSPDPDDLEDEDDDADGDDAPG